MNIFGAIVVEGVRIAKEVNLRPSVRHLMLIGIDLTHLVSGRIGGSESYVRSLIDELQALDSQHHFYVFVSAESAFLCHHPRFQVVANPVDAVRRYHATSRIKRLRQKLTGRPLLRALEDGWQQSVIGTYGLDVWFAPLTALTAQPLGCASVVTILDLQHEVLPHFFADQEHARRARVYPVACDAATRVIAISEFAQRELTEIYGVDEAKVDTIPLAHSVGLTTGKHSKTSELQVIADYGVRKPFCFYPANTYPHKNHVRLLNAFREIHEQSETDLQLVLTGASQWGESAVASSAADLIDAGRVVRLGHIPFEHLPILYQNAEFMVFPSLYEGFGIPLLEAMQSGCPVLTTRCGSIPEVAGDAALFVDGEDEDSIADGILRLYQDANLRATLVERGRIQSEKFSYRRCAEQTLETLEKAVKDAQALRTCKGGSKSASYGKKTGSRAKDAWPHSTCVGRHNVVYDQSFLQFRCPDSKSLQLRLEPVPMNCKVQVFCNGVPAVNERLLAGQSLDSRFSCDSDENQLLRLDFFFQLHGLQVRMAALRRPLETRIQELKVIRQDGSVFQLIGVFDD